MKNKPIKKSRIKQLKEKKLKDNKDKKINKKLIHKQNKKQGKAAKKLAREVKTKKYQINKQGEIARKKRIRLALLFVVLIFGSLCVRVGYIQFVKGDWLKQMAYTQQTLDRKINPKRGTIFDSTGKVVLATSSSVETVTVNPLNISEENKEKFLEFKKRYTYFSPYYDFLICSLKWISYPSLIDETSYVTCSDNDNEKRLRTLSLIRNFDYEEMYKKNSKYTMMLFFII